LVSEAIGSSVDKGPGGWVSAAIGGSVDKGSGGSVSEASSCLPKSGGGLLLNLGMPPEPSPPGMLGLQGPKSSKCLDASIASCFSRVLFPIESHWGQKWMGEIYIK